MQELNSKKETEVAEPKDEKPTKASIEQLPLPVIRSKLKEKGIKFKTTDKKKDLIEALLTGESTIKPKEIKRAPRLEEQKSVTALPILTKELTEGLKVLESKGLVWELDETSNCINFMRDIPTCANLDQSDRNIMRTARDAFAGNAPAEVSHNKPMFG